MLSLSLGLSKGKPFTQGKPTALQRNPASHNSSGRFPSTYVVCAKRQSHYGILFESGRNPTYFSLPNLCIVNNRRSSYLHVLSIAVLSFFTHEISSYLTFD